MIKSREFKNWEKVAIYLAEKSVGRSIPTWMYDVKKPEKLEEMLKECKKRYMIRKCVTCM